MAEEYKRFNKGKLRMSLCPIECIESNLKVFENGAGKYGDDNWKNAKNVVTFLDSAQRHLMELYKGNLIDAESGLPHASHVSVNMIMYHYLTSVKPANDILEDEKLDEEIDKNLENSLQSLDLQKQIKMNGEKFRSGVRDKIKELYKINIK